MRRLVLGCIALVLTSTASAEETDLARQLGKLDVTPNATRNQQFLDVLRGRQRAANARSSATWATIQDRARWEKFRDQALQSLRTSLGRWPDAPAEVRVVVTRRHEGDGFVVENLCYESRPGLVVTANLYAPAKPAASMPALVLVHSHHHPKHQSELQDMGMTWARLGCVVLVPDLLGHGERRQHPFSSADRYAGAFRPTRQDYYFRYNTGLQLHVVGESLIGWMAWDLMRGIDLLVKRPGVDARRIAILGAVAGGGDPAAVTAALDPRITAVVPFNFGGPQPETKYPLPDDAETAFNYLGGGSWESTRNLRLSGRDGFLPWVIVGSVAPRGLVHAHEFAWDRQRDPVWKRYQKIYSFYDAGDRLAAAHGSGSVQGRAPEATHCNNIGPVHRQQIYPAFEKWFSLPAPAKEYHHPLPAADLVCLTDAAREKLKPRLLHELLGELADQQASDFRIRLEKQSGQDRRSLLRTTWAKLLGLSTTRTTVALEPVGKAERIDSVTVLRTKLVHRVDPFPVEETPVLFLVPDGAKDRKVPVVIALAYEGQRGFLTRRADAIAGLLQKGTAVCIPDLRGTGFDGRGRSSASTSVSSSEQMLGRTMLGTRLEELHLLLDEMRSVLKPSRITLWGESFAPVNDPGRSLAVPHDADRFPVLAEPLGGQLALFGALFRDDVDAVHVRGGLVSMRTLLDSPFLYVPHDAVVPGALTAGDLVEVARALAPRPVRLEALVDGRNRRIDTAELKRVYTSMPHVNVANQASSDAELVRLLTSTP